MNEEIRKPDPKSLPPAGQFPSERYFIAVPQASYERVEADLLDYLSAIMRYKWLILIIVLICTATAATYAFLATPIYRASVLMAPVADNASKNAFSNLAAQYGDLASMVGINLGSSSNTTDEAIATLKSRVFTDQFIKDHHLLPVLFASKWDAKAKKWNVRDPARVPTMGDAYHIFSKKIRRVDEDKSTGMVTLSIDWQDRRQAAAWANELVKQLNRRMRDRAIREARKSMAYLKQELNKTSVVDLQQGIDRLIEAQIKQIMLASVREQYAFRVIDPAVVPDADKFVTPKRPLIVVIGFVLGGLFALIVIMTYDAISQRREAHDRERPSTF